MSYLELSGQTIKSTNVFTSAFSQSYADVTCNGATATALPVNVGVIRLSINDGALTPLTLPAGADGQRILIYVEGVQNFQNGNNSYAVLSVSQGTNAKKVYFGIPGQWLVLNYITGADYGWTDGERGYAGFQTSLYTASPNAQTLTAAQLLLGDRYYRLTPAAGIALTLPLGADVETALAYATGASGENVGTKIASLTIANISGGAFAVTVTGAVGMVVRGTAAIPQGGTAKVEVYRTAAGVYDAVVVLSA